MEYKPSPTSRRSDLAVIGLFAIAVVSFGVSSLPVRFAWIMRIVGIVTLTATLYIAIRYRLTQFVYSVSGNVGDEVLTVFRDRGRNKVAECRVSMSFLRSVRRFEDKNELKSALSGCEVYSYTQTMSPDSFVLAVFESDGPRDLAVILECDGAFEHTLAAYAEQNPRDRSDIAD